MYISLPLSTFSVAGYSRTYTDHDGGGRDSNPFLKSSIFGGGSSRGRDDDMMSGRSMSQYSSGGASMAGGSGLST